MRVKGMVVEVRPFQKVRYMAADDSKTAHFVVSKHPTAPVGAEVPIYYELGDSANGSLASPADEVAARIGSIWVTVMFLSCLGWVLWLQTGPE